MSKMTIFLSKRSFNGRSSLQKTKIEKHSYLETESTLFNDDCEEVKICKKVHVFIPQQIALVKKLLKEAKN
jgi:hypothetical protein